VHLAALEKTARAFQGCFLAPTEGIRRIIGHEDPSSENAIALVGKTYGVGRTLAINRLRDVFHLAAHTRSAMEARASSSAVIDYDVIYDRDLPPPLASLRGGPLLERVEKALERGLIPVSRAHRYLDIPVTAPLPLPELPHSIRRPLVSDETRARRAAFTYLVPRHPGLFPKALQRLPDARWRVTVCTGAGQDRGDLLISKDGTIDARVRSA